MKFWKKPRICEPRKKRVKIDLIALINLISKKAPISKLGFRICLGQLSPPWRDPDWKLPAGEIRIIRNLAFCLIILSLLILSFLQKAWAQTMSNSSYILQMGNLNQAAGRPTGPSYKLNITVGQTGPGLYSGANYTVRAGFQ